MPKKKFDKVEINEKINEVIAQIKTNSKDVHFAETLIDNLLSLKGQKDVEPMEMCVPLKDVIKRYDFDSFEIVNCKSGIIFHAKGGYYAFVTPRMKCLYGHLSSIIELKDDYDSLNEELKGMYDNLFIATIGVMQIPMFAPSSAELLFDMNNFFAEKLNKYIETLMKTPLMEEDHLANAEYENIMEAIDDVSKIKTEVE